jgi:hypothetical protein
MVNTDQVDRILAGLGAAHDRIAAALYAIDSQPALGFLRAGPLTGTTAARWQTLSPEIDRLWAHFTLLGSVLDEARAVRSSKRPNDPQWTEMATLLRDPAIGLDTAGMPAIGGAPAATWVRLGELAQQLEQRCAAIAGQLSEVDVAWSVVANRLVPVAEAVDAVAALAGELGEAGDTAAPLQRRLAAFDLSDPLAAAPGGRLSATADAKLRELDADVAAARARLTEMGRLREGYPQRIAALRSLADEVGAAERQVAEAYARASEKIAEPGLGQPPAAAAVLHRRIDELERLGRDAKWGDLADGLALGEQSAQRARSRAGELRATADGLLARRDELRGRLDAYRAKALAKGFGEHRDLTTRYDDAHKLLFTAPCDLRGATRAVFAYQQTLASLTEESAS